MLKFGATAVIALHTGIELIPVAWTPARPATTKPALTAGSTTGVTAAPLRNMVSVMAVGAPLLVATCDTLTRMLVIVRLKSPDVVGTFVNVTVLPDTTPFTAP